MKINRFPLHITSACLLIIAGVGHLSATDYYLTVAGAGTHDGSSWANALAATSMVTAVNTTMLPGDTLYVSGPEVSGGANYGDLRFSFTSSGTSTARKQWVGVDRGFGYPVFRGTQTTRSYTTFTFADTVSFWTLKNVQVEHRDISIATAGGAHDGLTFENVTVRDARSKCYSISESDNTLFKNCRSERYSARGFVIGSGCDNMTFKGCVADYTGTGWVDDPAFRAAAVSDPVGFDFHTKGSTAPPNTNILLEDCVAMNNDEDTANTTDYEQGDGIKFEGSNDGVTLKRCLMALNQDGGCDLKGTNNLVQDCVSVNNKRYGFKIWYEGTFENCIGANNGARQLQIPGTTGGHTIVANFCTFHCATSSQFGIALDNNTNTVQLNDSILSLAGATGSYNGSGVILTNSVKLANTSNPANAPMYHNPVTPWDGQGDNYDNNTYGATKGYNSQAISYGRVIGYNLTDATNSLVATDEVGVIPTTNWNNSVNNNETLTNVLDDSGTATTADISSGNTAAGYDNATPILAAPLTDDAKMMRSQRAKSNDGVMTVTAVQVPYTTYDVYVYWGGRITSETLPATMTLDFQQLSGGVYTTTQSKYIKDSNGSWDGTYNESTATAAIDAVDGNEYVVFRGLTAPEFKVVSTMGRRTGISGIQIVEQ